MLVLIRILARWQICSRGRDELLSVTSLMHVLDVVEVLERRGLGFSTSLEHKFFVISNKFEIARVLHPPEMQPCASIHFSFFFKVCCLICVL